MRPTVVVGVHAHAEPARLAETIQSLTASVDDRTAIVLLPDGPDAALSAALSADPAFTSLPRWGTAKPLGPPACFNRLAARSESAVVVFVESGTVLGPGCLRLMAESLTRPQRGLAGPSTNRSWNEQAVFPDGRACDLDETAMLARRRYGSSVRSLEPLHSLADFCLAVRREVIDAIGGADEGYGLGPCWEMDYNIRAARAGFEGVWVRSAYAFRHPFTDRRRLADARLIETSRRRYQDHFCGLRLGGARTDYENHCLGEACEYFAPPSLVSLRRPVGDPGPGTTELWGVPRQSRAPATRAAIVAASASTPLVTAIMPTRGRPDFALQAVRYFLAQDYANKELLVLEDGPSSLAGVLPHDLRIRYVAVRGASRSIGTLRNEACRLARGDIVAHWDDDDWYGTERLTRQVTPIHTGEADITALRDGPMLDLASWRFWRCRPDLHRRLFVRDVHGGTLVYRRRIWQEKAQFPNSSLAEDAAFLEQAVRRGARLRAVEAAGIFLYVRHGANAWTFACGQAGGADGWELTQEPDWLAEDRAFYMARSAGAPSPRATPLVSCIMPTCDRRSFVPQAIRYFQRQDYPARELVIVDDGLEPVRDLLPADPRIAYHRLESKTILGTKRNMACELARGSVIVHWDDDDWASPRRLSTQVAALTGQEADICGAASLLYYDPAHSAAWRFTWPVSQRSWAAGASLCYPRELWSRSPFPDIAIGEDNRFVFSPAVRRIADVRAADCIVGIIHERNCAPKTGRGPQWSPRPVREVEDLIGDDMAYYRRHAGSGPGRTSPGYPPHPGTG
jgi:glycosyltransferase involved in cell wall biosynthesis/GT2 family glycosyltransferase